MKKSRLSKVVQRRLIDHFVAETTAQCTASLAGVNVKTACYDYPRLRVTISQQQTKESGEVFKGGIEVDESYFWGTRKGKRGGHVYTKIIPDASIRTLIPIIESKVVPDSTAYSDCWKGFTVLEFKHYRISRSKLFADMQNHINGIGEFWNQAKRHMRMI